MADIWTMDRSERLQAIKDVLRDLAVWPMEVHGEPFGSPSSLAAGSGLMAAGLYGNQLRHGFAQGVENLKDRLRPRSQKQVQRFQPPTGPRMARRIPIDMKPPGALTRFGRAVGPHLPSAAGRALTGPLGGLAYVASASPTAAREYDTPAKTSYLSDMLLGSVDRADRDMRGVAVERQLAPTRRNARAFDRFAEQLARADYNERRGKGSPSFYELRPHVVPPLPEFSE